MGEMFKVVKNLHQDDIPIHISNLPIVPSMMEDIMRLIQKGIYESSGDGEFKDHEIIGIRLKVTASLDTVHKDYIKE